MDPISLTAVSKTLVIAIAFLAAEVLAQQCFFPDGITVVKDVPCNKSASVSPCCGASTWCLDNGLCYGNGAISRGSCTDRNWGEGCCQYCKTVNVDGGMPLQRCSSRSNSFVCDFGNNGETLGGCNNTSAQFTVTGGNSIILRDSQAVNLQGGQSAALEIFPDRIVPTKAVNSLASNDSTPTNTGLNTATTTMNAAAGNGQETSARGYTSVQLAGAVVGIGLPLLLALIVALFVIFSLRKQLRSSREIESSAAAGWPKARDEQASPQKYDINLLDSAQRNELDALSMPQELDGRRDVQ